MCIFSFLPFTFRALEYNSISTLMDSMKEKKKQEINNRFCSCRAFAKDTFEYTGPSLCKGSRLAWKGEFVCYIK